jgi:hypothetical protein
MSLAVLLLLQVATGQPQTGQDVVAQLTFDAALDPSVFETSEWKRPGWIRK